MMTRRNLGWFLAATLACGLCRAAADKPAAQADQGIKGKVVKLTGNHMPGPGAAGGKVQPLSVPVHIFKGKVKPFRGPANKNPSYVQTVTSGKDGQYSVSLNAGEYTVVAEINGVLYLNCFDDAGHWGTASVAQSQWTTWDIQDTSEATF